MEAHIPEVLGGEAPESVERHVGDERGDPAVEVQLAPLGQQARLELLGPVHAQLA